MSSQSASSGGSASRRPSSVAVGKTGSAGLPLPGFPPRRGSTGARLLIEARTACTVSSLASRSRNHRPDNSTRDSGVTEKPGLAQAEATTAITTNTAAWRVATQGNFVSTIVLLASRIEPDATGFALICTCCCRRRDFSRCQKAATIPPGRTNSPNPVARRPNSIDYAVF